MRTGTVRSLLVPLLAVAFLLALAPDANATHGSGYWFYNGYLPKADGYPAVVHVAGCCGPWVIVRMSWEPWTHDMKFVFIRWNGNWNSYWAQSSGHENEWDITQILPQDTYRSGGCMNAAEWAWWEVWTNCHVRNTIA
jgi:hypothetical protein